MKSCEPFLDPSSEYYIFLPGRAAQAMFFYPLCVGHFLYQPGYSLQREAYDSFLLLYVEKGSLTLAVDGHGLTAGAGSFVFLNCYRPHAYATDTGCEALWCHFDGPCAKNFYDAVTGKLGTVFSGGNSGQAVQKLWGIYRAFEKNGPLREPLLSKSINDILTDFLLRASGSAEAGVGAGMWEEIVSYIGEHFPEDISVETLASRAGLSQYHFIRSFKRETGFTPHEYLVSVRMNNAKYLLKNSSLSVKEICFRTGFSCESVFCSAFKKHQGMTPLAYRESARI